MTQIFLQGFFLQASLILALGAQNIFVLNSGLKKERHLLVATICSLCDAILIFIGVLGVATVFVQVPILKILLGVFGVLFLLYYGILKLIEAKRGVKFSQVSDLVISKRKIILTTLGFSLLNPHVYLDTVVLIGGYSTKFGDLFQRFYFGLGAAIFSILWFFCLAILASSTSAFFKNKNALRLVALISSLILLALSVKLGIEIYSWI